MNEKGLKLKKVLSDMVAHAGLKTVKHNIGHGWIDINDGALFIDADYAVQVIKRADKFYNAFVHIDYQTALKYSLVYIYGSEISLLFEEQNN